MTNDVTNQPQTLQPLHGVGKDHDSEALAGGQARPWCSTDANSSCRSSSAACSDFSINHLA